MEKIAEIVINKAYKANLKAVMKRQDNGEFIFFCLNIFH
jgi:hypothetical protein